MAVFILYLFRSLFFHLEYYKGDFYKRNYTFCGITSYTIQDTVSQKSIQFFQKITLT